MGLYSFKKQFIPFILDGRKTHTIRANRKDGWVEKPGNTMHLYTGLRTKSSQLLMRVECAKVEGIAIAMRPYTGKGVLARGCSFPEVFIDGNELSGDEKETLARRDGFRNFAEMMAFWEGRLPFSGHIIHWKAPKKAKVDKTVCRKTQGRAEEGNTCLQTPGTCESCPEWTTAKKLPTRAQIDARIAQLHALFEANPNWENSEVDYGICTNCARFIQKEIGGRVVGYHREGNPTAKIGDDGHDFLLIGSFLVDVWAHEYEERRALYDLSNRGDEKLVRRLYGPREKWHEVKP